MKNIKTLLVTTLLTGLACAGTAQAQRILVSPGDSIEVAASRVMMPSGGLGSVVVSQCDSCETYTLSLTSESALYLGKQLVTAQEFQEAVNTRPDRLAVVFYRFEDNVVTRIDLEQ